MVSLVLFDDVYAHNELLEVMLRQLIDEKNLPARVVLGTTKSLELFEYARTHPDGNVYFLDIELNEQYTGVDICKAIQQIDPKAYIIYVSAYPHYAMECIKSHAFDFLLKPFTRDDLLDCLAAMFKDMESRAKSASSMFTIPMGSRMLLVEQADIRYLLSQRTFLTANTTKGRYKWRGSLTGTLELLDTGTFFRISRGCVVNLSHVSEVNWPEGLLVMDDGNTLTVSRRMYASLREHFKVGWPSV